MSEVAVGLESGLGLENLTGTEINYHLYSQGAFDENCKFMQLDLQIIVIWWVYIDYQIRRPIQKELIVPHIYFAVRNSE